MSDNNKNSELVKSALTKEEIDKKRQNITATVFFSLITVSTAIIIIGGIWLIGDLFSQEKLAIFLTLPLPVQIFIIGLIVVGLFFLGILMLIIYRRGKNLLLKLLFGVKTDEDLKEKEEYLPAKIITAGALISFCVIFIGLIIALIQSMIEFQSETTGFWIFLGDLTGGGWILLIGLILMVLTGLILGAFYSWQNGYYFFLNKILKRKEGKSEYSFSNNQKIIGRVFFVIFVIATLMIIFGIIWAIIDALVLDWGNTFRTYPFGIQFSILGIFFTSLFGLLIVAMMLFKWGNKQILNSLFGKKHPEIKKESTLANVITIGIISGIFLIIIGILAWLVSLAAGIEFINLFLVLLDLSIGLLIMSIGVIIAIFLLLILAFAYSYNNGYSYILKIVKTGEQLAEE
jgi:hypothetical protein